jgi:hypothetical protein
MAEELEPLPQIGDACLLFRQFQPRVLAQIVGEA